MKKYRLLIAFLIAIAILGIVGLGAKVMFTPRNLSREDPRKAFESFVASPIPQSVHGIKADGTIAFAGSNVFIDFQLDPKDLDQLLKQGKFQPADKHAPDWVEEFQPEGEVGEISRYIRRNDSMRQAALFVSADRKRAWFWESGT